MYFYVMPDHVKDGKMKEDIVEYINNYDIKTVIFKDLPINQIPRLDNIQKLNIINCPVEEIPTMDELELLTLIFTNVRSVPDFPNLTDLFCQGTSIEELPSVETGLISLHCIDASIKEVPNYRGLTYLNCRGCKKIKKIPYLPNLRNIITDGSSLSSVGITSEYAYRRWKKKVDAQIQIIRSNKLSKDLARVLYTYLK